MCVCVQLSAWLRWVEGKNIPRGPSNQTLISRQVMKKSLPSRTGDEGWHSLLKSLSQCIVINLLMRIPLRL